MNFRRRLRLLRAELVSACTRLGMRGIGLHELQAKLSPVFVIGGNRSGTSIVSLMLSQHADLEGLFQDDAISRTLPSGHSIGFAESMHVWPSLLPDDRERTQRGQWPLWCLPEYLSGTYRNSAKSDREKLRLAWDVERLRGSANHPLIKDQFNTLRIGLVTDVFPKARFVLVSRQFEDFARRGIRKWAKDQHMQTSLNSEEPRVSLHWHLINLIARYDLETYAPGQYTEIWLHELEESPESAQEALARVVKRLDLEDQEFDLGVLRPRGSDSVENSLGSGVEDDHFKSVRSMVGFERDLLQDYFS